MDRAEGRKGADPNLFVEEEREMEASEGIGRGNGDGKPTPAEHRKVRWVHLHGQDETIWEVIACWFVPSLLVCTYMRYIDSSF